MQLKYRIDQCHDIMCAIKEVADVDKAIEAGRSHLNALQSLKRYLDLRRYLGIGSGGIMLVAFGKPLGLSITCYALAAVLLYIHYRVQQIAVRVESEIGLMAPLMVEMYKMKNPALRFTAAT